MDAPSGCWSIVEAQVIDALPQLAAFRAFCGASTPEEAAVYVSGKVAPLPADGDAFDPEEIAYRKYNVIVSSASENGFGMQRVSLHEYIAYGELYILLERHLTEQQMYDPGLHEQILAHDRWMKNHTFAILSELADYLVEHGGPHIRTIEIASGPFWNHESQWATEGQLQGVEIHIAWGVNDE
jgi:hypothetical protein